jgi:hypothetical protein
VLVWAQSGSPRQCAAALSIDRRSRVGGAVSAVVQLLDLLVGAELFESRADLVSLTRRSDAEDVRPLSARRCHSTVALHLILWNCGWALAVSGRVLREAAQSFAGADRLFGRAGERAVQDRGGGEVERLPVVAQALGDLAVAYSPLPVEHINLVGRYHLIPAETVQRGAYRPFRTASQLDAISA